MFNPKTIKGLIVDDAVDIALLFGLFNKNNPSVIYSCKPYGDYELISESRVIPNSYARLDILYIDKTPVGTIVSIQIAPGLYHIVGLFVAEPYRTHQVSKTLKNFLTIEPNEEGRGFLPSEILLRNYLNDLVIKKGGQVTLEVKNGNTHAWRLYEKPIYNQAGSTDKRSFELLTKAEVEAYAAVRKKTIKKWYEIETGRGVKGCGVQWGGIPEFGEQTIRWSVNRVYVFKLLENKFVLAKRRGLSGRSNIYKLITIIKYGAFWKYLIYKIKRRLNAR